MLFVFSIQSGVLVPRGTKVVLVETKVSFDSLCGEREKCFSWRFFFPPPNEIGTDTIIYDYYDFISLAE